MKRKVYDRQYKIAAVKLALSKEISVTQAAQQLGISISSLYSWIGQYKEYGESAFQGKGNALFNPEYEIKKLQKANNELKMENKLLKKLQAFLKRNNV